MYCIEWIWSYKGTLLTPLAKLVVSDNGDILSPNHAPETTAPTTNGTGILVVEAIPTIARPIVATEPNEVPVNSLVSAQSTKASGTNIFGDTTCIP